MRKIRSVRRAKGITQEELARLAGCSQPMISNWELGHSEITYRQLRRVARALGVPIAALVEDLDVDDLTPASHEVTA